MATLRAQEEKADGTNRVIVSKQDMRITVLCPQGDTLAVFPIACGRNYGDKQQEWDFRTPEGHFVIESVEDTSLWPRDSTRQETPGEIYGPRFFRLKAFSRLVDVDTRVDILPDKGRERGSLSKLARDDDY